MQSLQQSILSITFYSFLSITNLASTLGCPPHNTQRPSLMEIWDYSTSVFYEFRSLCQSPSPIPAAAAGKITDIACHLLWTDETPSGGVLAFLLASPSWKIFDGHSSLLAMDLSSKLPGNSLLKRIRCNSGILVNVYEILVLLYPSAMYAN